MTKVQGDNFGEQRSYRPRKLLLDSDIYCPYSMRESDGDVHCDHDFDEKPNVAEPTFAIWNCTVCGRSVRFDVWH